MSFNYQRFSGKVAGGGYRGQTRKGVINKRSQGLLAMIQKDFPNYHPVMEMAKLANDPDASRDERFAANKEVAKYVTPVLKAIEHTGEGGGPLQHLISANPMTLEEWEAAQKDE